MNAPQRFVDWMAAHEHTDRRYGHTYRYHSRSDAHSIALCAYILDDILDACPVLRDQALQGSVAYGINIQHVWSTTRKAKTFDLAFGPPVSFTQPTSSITRASQLADVWLSCEAKSVMTEHGKSQPRVYDEISSSHEIVHQGKPDAIATGISVVNIAPTFASPLRQTSVDHLYMTEHKQPYATGRMVNHLRGLPIRDKIGQVGFDAYTTIVIATDNLTTVSLWTDPPAPQLGDPDHYDTFIARIAQFYVERFSG